MQIILLFLLTSFCLTSEIERLTVGLPSSPNIVQIHPEEYNNLKQFETNQKLETFPFQMTQTVLVLEVPNVNCLKYSDYVHLLSHNHNHYVNLSKHIQISLFFVELKSKD